MKRSKDGFKFRWTSMIFYIALCMIITAGLLAVMFFQKPLVQWLTDYEESLPKYEVERIFNEYFLTPDAASLIELAENKPVFKFPDTYEDAVASYAEKIAGKDMTYGYVAGSERRTVNVKADGVRVARFSIKEKSEKSKYGMQLYELDKIELYYDEPEEYASVMLPERYTAYTGGVAVGEEYLTKNDITLDERQNVPDGAYLFRYKVYTIGGLYKKPEFTVYDEKDKRVELEYDEKTDMWSCKYEYSEQLKEQYSEYVLEAMEKYAVYMQNDAKFRTIRDYFDPSSQLYKNIYDNPGSFVWEHDGYKFDNGQTGEFFDYGGVISCRVSFDHILVKRGKEDYVDHCDFTVYLHAVDGVYKIFYMESNI